MKLKFVFPLFLAIAILSISASAAMQCSITDAAACTGGDKAIVLRISELVADGGSHAGFARDSSFTKAVCCSGVLGLTSTITGTEAAYTKAMLSVTDTADGHAAKTKIPGYTQINLTSPNPITCAYSGLCSDDETCLFTISGDDDAHISGCGAVDYPFSYSKLCCKAGESGCRINEIYWGVFDETTGFEILSGTTEPLGPVGLGVDVFLIAETSGCRSSTADFEIYQEGGSDPYYNEKNIPMGYARIGAETGPLEDELGNPIPDVVITAWSAGFDEDTLNTGEYKFKVLLKSSVPSYSISSDFSQSVEVSDKCMAIDPRPYCSLTEDEEKLCGDDCILGDDGTLCPDRDCDEVANCIDRFTGTVADPELVEKCSGDARGTAGCIPAMDCTNLVWSECKNCEAGQPCEAEFPAGTMFMERQKDPVTGTYNCKWISGFAPTGCTDTVLNQYNNRFKECIEDEEFPFFDGFNIIAVLLILSMYYAVIIIRKKK
ncbi:MAG: hypothetical protein V1734_01975 [Nanoarchaeota archaeon]